MIKKLKELSKKAYAPYSNFRVAAILESNDGQINFGFNIENVAFPSSMCAERVAIFSAKLNGVDLRKVINIHIYSPDADFILAPCGGCRQVMTEHLNLNTNVIMYSNDGTFNSMTLEQIVPSPILAKSLLSSKK